MQGTAPTRTPLAPLRQQCLTVISTSRDIQRGACTSRHSILQAQQSKGLCIPRPRARQRRVTMQAAPAAALAAATGGAPATTGAPWRPALLMTGIRGLESIVAEEAAATLVGAGGSSSSSGGSNEGSSAWAAPVLYPGFGAVEVPWPGPAGGCMWWWWCMWWWCMISSIRLGARREGELWGRQGEAGWWGLRDCPTVLPSIHHESVSALWICVHAGAAPAWPSVAAAAQLKGTEAVHLLLGACHVDMWV